MHNCSPAHEPVIRPGHVPKAAGKYDGVMVSYEDIDRAWHFPERFSALPALVEFRDGRVVHFGNGHRDSGEMQ